jgi:putative membrane protein
MIIRPRPSPFGLLFILRGSIVPTIAPRVLAVMALSALVVALHRAFPQYLRDVTAAPFTLFGVALSIFLGFRNSTCYDRWWEGRKQWGQLVAEVRSLCREFRALLPDDPALQRRCAHRVAAFAHALRAQLRRTDDTAHAWLPPAEWQCVARGRNHADLILLALADELRALLLGGAISDMFYRVLSERMQAMTTIQTACERLRATPTPFTYTLLLHRTAWLFCLLLPFGVVSTLGLATPLLTAVLAYAFFGLDALGDELEEPFGTSANALPLDALVRTIEIAVAEALNDPEVPQPLQARRFLLT